jgi:EpsI family protein
MNRALILAGLFAATAASAAFALRPEQVPARRSLETFPVELGRWRGADEPPFSQAVMATLGVDEYLDRLYDAPDEVPVALYVGYYKSQRQGDSIHSPLNCLPGAGWQPLEKTRVAVGTDAAGREASANRLVIQKGLDRQVVLYWYQSHGRIVASEYVSKAYMIFDAVRYNRSDAALVRVISPITASERDDTGAGQRVLAFAQAILPRLDA